MADGISAQLSRSPPHKCGNSAELRSLLPEIHCFGLCVLWPFPRPLAAFSFTLCSPTRFCLLAVSGLPYGFMRLSSAQSGLAMFR